MRNFIIFLILIFISTQTLAVDVYSTSTKKSCYGLFLSIVGSNTKYTTFKNFDTPIEGQTFAKVLPSKDIKPTALKMYAFFNKNIPVEVFDEKTSKPLQKLKEKELYTFVLTKDELRVAETTRTFGALKNFLTKHYYLSKGDEVYYAGEAWFENGILVINHNSGTFRPSPADLPAVAEYFKKILKADEVQFSNLLPGPEPLIPIKAYVERFKAYIASLKTSLSSSIIHLFIRNKHSGEVISVATDGTPGQDVVFKVGEKIGNGFYGVVYKTEVVSVSKKASFKFPEFMENGKPSNQLVVKFPNNVPVVKNIPGMNIFNQALTRERDEIKRLSEAATDYYNKASDIVLSGHYKNTPFLIKKFVSAKNFEVLARIQSKLTDEQIASLEDDIYEMAKRIKEKLNLDLDIKAENLAWDETNKRFVLFEMTVRHSGGFVNNQGFSSYLEYVKVRFNHWNKMRKPASVDSSIIHLARSKSDSFIIPSTFLKKFSTEDERFIFDFKKDLLQIDNAPFEGEFIILSYDYNDRFSQIVFKIINKNDPEKTIKFAIRNEDHLDKYSMVFEALSGNKIVAQSIIYNLVIE